MSLRARWVEGINCLLNLAVMDRRWTVPCVNVFHPFIRLFVRLAPD